MTSVSLKPILVAVDVCKQSLHYASQLADRLGEQLLILHVVHETAQQSGYYRRRDMSGQALPLDYVAERLLDDFVEEVRSMNDVGNSLEEVETRVVTGIPGHRILEIAKLYDASMILLGSVDRVGETGATRRLWTGVGSTSRYLLRHCKIPLLTPEGEVGGEQRRLTAWQTGVATHL